MNRYAIYFAPRAHSRWWSVWSGWLGHDAIKRTPLARPNVSGVEPGLLAELVKEPSRYGLHATLKAPFKLRTGAHISDLEEFAINFAAQQQPFTLNLKIERLGNFFALTPVQVDSKINTLAGVIVKEFARFAMPPSQSEIDRRRLSGLSAHQDEMLLRWGYPYVMDCFRFHISLSGHLKGIDSNVETLIKNALNLQLNSVISEPLVFDSICLFEEPAAGQNFFLKKRFDFAT